MKAKWITVLTKAGAKMHVRLDQVSTLQEYAWREDEAPDYWVFCGGVQSQLPKESYDALMAALEVEPE